MAGGKDDRDLWQFCPAPPDWRLDWAKIEGTFACVRSLAGCPQNPAFHAEGDVLVHTRMVCEALAQSATWQALAPRERAIVFAATLLHDVGKPHCTKDENGRITSRGHSACGAQIARGALWELRPDASSLDFFQMREAVVALVRHHGLPLYFLDRPDPERSVIEASMTARPDWLAILAAADVCGRECTGKPELLDRVALFCDFAAEHHCLTSPFRFPTDHTRFTYFRTPGRVPGVEIFDDTQCEVLLLSGLPASGKDAWLREHARELPVIALDQLRSELDVPPDDNQGAVTNEARDRARSMLRQRNSFAWNATNTTRQLRRQLIDLFAGYRAKIRIVYVETSPDELTRRNGRRSHPVPEHVIERLRSRLNVPNATESHSIEVVIT